MTTIHFSNPTRSDLSCIASRLCAADRDELAVQGHDDPLSVILTGWQSSRECYVACWDGAPQAVFGVADYTSDDRFGVPWLLSTGTAHKVRREFLIASKRYVRGWSPMYLAMFNLVDARHVNAHLWLSSIGFAPWKVHDINGYPFIEFGLIHV